MSTSKGHTNTVAIILIIALVSFLTILAIIYILLRTFRRTHPTPKYVPTSYLKSRWLRWSPGSSYNPLSRSTTRSKHRRNGSTAYEPSTTATDDPNINYPSTEVSTSTADVDRRTSVRSIMTLPPYRPTPTPSERLIAREGERGGVDTVIEFPETAEEEEGLREEAMESLYQIRQARRREIEEREERRRERAAAREAGDWARLEQLRLQHTLRARADSAASSTLSVHSRAASATAPAASELIAEHNSRESGRERRVSSVSYADLGLARHDGSRLRAGSAESDKRPLLSEAAGMGASRTQSRPSSRSRMWISHHRDRSVRSVESAQTAESENNGVLTPTTRGGRSGSDPERTPSASEDTPTGSEGTEELPMGEPPRYEEGLGEVPPYTSPVFDRAPQLPPLRAVPSIEVTAGTPASSVPATPIEGDWGRRCS